MASRNNPVFSILDGNRIEAMGLREIILKLKPKSPVLIYSRADEFLGESPESTDILCVSETALVLYGDKLRNRKFQLIPIVRNASKAEEALSQNEEVVPFICSEWTEEEIRRSIKGALDQNQAKKSREEEKGLSRRELDVLKEVARGLTNKEIADKLDISMNTVMTHRKNITAKLNIKTVSGLTFYALMNNYISGDEMENKGTE